jgi:hypothetical protein
METTRAAPTRRFTRGVIAALVFGVAYTLGAAVYSLSVGNTEFVFYVVVMAVLGLLVAGVHWRVGFTTFLIWALAVWGLLHMCGGLVKVGGDAGVLYNLWLIGHENGKGIKFDQLVHAYGFGAATWACWESLRVKLARKRPDIPTLIACVLAGEGLGAINEIIEFTATKIMPRTNVGDYDNNSWDLVFNLAGCIIAAALIWMRGRSTPGNASNTPAP